jgi:S-adenosylmethionine:tRNA-ribosyltransferase-isomerase (queuine synthetase)
MNPISKFLAKLLGQLHVDAVMASVHKTINKLEAVVEHHVEQERRHLEAERASAVAKVQAAEQRILASKLITRIRALLG